jgi:hypothetical protein
MRCKARIVETETTGRGVIRTGTDRKGINLNIGRWEHGGWE